VNKKHFQQIADTLVWRKPGKRERVKRELWRALVLDFAEALATTNTRFNRVKFLDACGYEPENTSR